MFKCYMFKYKQSFISCLSPFFSYIIIQVVLLFIAFTAEFILGQYKIEFNKNQYTIVISSITVIAELIFILLYHRDIKELFKNSFRYLLDVINIKFVIILIFFSFLIRALTVLPLAIILLIDNGISDSSVFSNSQGAIGYFGSIIACTLTPIFEEILFRGLILKKFCEHGLSFKKSNLLQTLVFMLFHGSIASVIGSFIFGLFQGEMRRRYKSILIPIIFHMIFNLFGIISRYFF